MKIASKLLKSYGLPYEGYDEVDVEYDRVTSTSRWSTFHELVFKWVDGKYYRAEYSKGSTEMQCEDPWEYEIDVECVEVELVPVTRLAWVPVENKEAV